MLKELRFGITDKWGELLYSHSYYLNFIYYIRTHYICKWLQTPVITEHQPFYRVCRGQICTLGFNLRSFLDSKKKKNTPSISTKIIALNNLLLGEKVLEDSFKLFDHETPYWFSFFEESLCIGSCIGEEG